MRLVIVEDEGLYRELLATALSSDPDLDVVGTFGSGATALEAVNGLAPDVALLDIELGGEPNGVQLGLLMRQRLPHLGIVLLSNFGSPRFLAALKPEEVAGWSYLLKRSVRDVSLLKHAIKAAAMGLVVLDPALVADRQPNAAGLVSRLTTRQREILELLALGWPNTRIADQLGLSLKTIDNQIALIYEHTGIEPRGDVHPRVNAVLMYLRETRQLAEWRVQPVKTPD
jgi:DNA-binding NarL/FixJ family response regulator